VTAVAVLGGTEPRAFEVLRDLGCCVIYVEESVPWEFLPLVDVPVEADLDDWEGVAVRLEAQTRRTPIDAVITHVEPRVPLMAYLNDRLGSAARSLDLEAAWNCRDKLRTRERLAAAGVPSPRYRLADGPAEAVAAADEIGYPVVVKPRDGAGGFGVRRCGDVRAVRGAAGRVLRRAAEEERWLQGVIVEEYLEGPELAVQTVGWNGQTEVVSVFEELLSPGPVFVELGYDAPPRITPAEQREVRDVVVAALRALGVDNWITHTQVRLTADGVRLIEVNARRPGGRLVTMTRAVGGIDLLEAAAELALGRRPARHEPQASCALYRSIVFEQAGRLSYETEPAWDDLESAILPIVELDVPPGEPVLPFDHPDGGVYGRILLMGDDRAALERDLVRVRARLALEVVA
jgi:biotin carboxylase